jgi:chemotaxis family two-component system response regulator PixH
MKTALIVEDLRSDMEALSSCLTDGGFSVIRASSSEEASSILERLTPDVILLDVVLPGRSGFELCRDLKAEDKTRRIPIVLCSSKNTEMDKFWGMKQGADAYLTKPLDRDEVLRTLQHVLR